MRLIAAWYAAPRPERGGDKALEGILRDCGPPSLGPGEVCFDLSVDVDVHQRSVAVTGERAVAGVKSGRMNLGDEVTWEARHLGRTRRLTSRITEYERPHRFVDEMVAGAFKSFRHEHSFKAVQGGTQMIDVFEYQSPLGPLGRRADLVLLRRYMRSLLTMRNRHIKEAAEAAGDGVDAPSSR
jgi:ligand-binding SRPBCC domain-containing protein